MTSNLRKAGRLALSTADDHGSASKTYVVHIACDHLQEQGLLEHYRNRLRNVLAASIFICGMVDICSRAAALSRWPRWATPSATSRPPRWTCAWNFFPGQPTELTTLALSFNDMLSRLEDAFSRISRYSADIAHGYSHAAAYASQCDRGGATRARTPDEYRDVLASCRKNASGSRG